jgi:tetratricopeptide (TPR) repeat protein
MSAQTQRLKEAKAAFDKQDWASVLSSANDVLEYDEQNYHALVFKGVAIFNLCLNELRLKQQTQLGKLTASAISKKADDSLDKTGISFMNAVASFMAAIKANNLAPTAWQGLAEVYAGLLPFKDDASLPSASSSYSKPLIDLILSAPSKLVEVYSTLLQLTPADQPAAFTKHNSFLLKLSDAQAECLRFQAARESLLRLLARLEAQPSASASDNPVQMKITVNLRLGTVLEKTIALFQKQQKSKRVAPASGPAAAPSKSPAPMSTSTASIPSEVSEQDAAAAATELVHVYKDTLALLAAAPESSIWDSVKTKVKYMTALEQQLATSSSGHHAIAVDLAVVSKELLATPEGRSFSYQPYEVLLRLYDQSRPGPGTRTRPSWHSPVNCLISRSYVERCVTLECFRRFPTRALAYIHFLNGTRSGWIHNTDDRDPAREWLLRLLGSSPTPDVKIPALLLLARIYRKVNQLGPVVETCKSLLEVIKEQQPTTGGESVYPIYWTEAMLLLAEALSRSRQHEAGQAAFRTILKQDPHNIAAARGLYELLYEKKQLVEAKLGFETSLKMHPADLWFRARVAWLDALPFIDWIAVRPGFDVDKCEDQPLLQEREALMFRAISAKNAILDVIEAEQKHRTLRLDELSSRTSRYRSREDAQADTELIGSASHSDHAACFDSDDLCSMYGFGYGWYEYWLGRIEWALGDPLAARDRWLQAAKWFAPVPHLSTEGASVAEAAALACLGQFYLTVYKKRGIESDLSTAQGCFEAALRKFPQQRLRRHFLHEGQGDGIILLEAALPLLDILLDSSFVKKFGAPASSSISDVDGANDDDADEVASVGAIVDKRAYAGAMALLTQLSQAKHHWALLKLGLCRMRSGEFNFAVAALQNYLRREPSDVNGWLALAHTYRRQGKWLAALKVAERVETIFREGRSSSATDPQALVKSQFLVGSTLLKLGFVESAARILSDVAKQTEETEDLVYISVLATLSLLSAFQQRCLDELRAGRYVSAKQTLTDAIALVLQLQNNANRNRLASQLVATWKSVADLYTLFYRVHDIGVAADGSASLAQLRTQALQHLRSGARAYLRAIQLDRESHGLYHDLSINYLFQAHLLDRLGASQAGADSSNLSLGSSYSPHQNEHLSMLDEAVSQIDMAISCAPPFVSSPGVALQSGLPAMRYRTVKGVIMSQYQRALDASQQPLPPTLHNVPSAGFNDAQSAFNFAINLSTRMAAASDGYFGGGSATFAWSNMLAHWIAAGAPKEIIAATAQYARNLNPTDPVPWTALVWALAESTASPNHSAGSQPKTLLREEMNALVHAIQLSPNLDFAVVILSRLVFLLQRADLDKTASPGISPQQLAQNLLRQISVHLERYANRHGGSQAPDIAAVHNLIGCVLMRIGLYSAATQHFGVASAAHLGAGKHAVVNLNLALALEKAGDSASAFSLFKQLSENPSVGASPEMNLAVAVGLFRTSVVVQPAAARGNLDVLKTRAESFNMLMVWQAKALHRLGAPADEIAAAVAAVLQRCNLDAKAAMVDFDQLIMAASSCAALSSLHRNPLLCAEACRLLSNTIQSCSLQVSQLDLSPPMPGAVVEMLQSHQISASRAGWLMQCQQQASHQLSTIRHADAIMQEQQFQASSHLLRAVHTFPWRAETWLKLASNFSISSSPEPLRLSTSPFLRDVPLLRLDNDGSTRQPFPDMQLLLQHQAVRVARLLSAGSDPCPDVVSEIFTDLSESKPVPEPGSTEQSRRARGIVHLASRAVHLSPWTESTWIILSSAVMQADVVIPAEPRNAILAAQRLAPARRSSHAMFPTYHYSGSTISFHVADTLKRARELVAKDLASCTSLYGSVIRESWQLLDPYILAATIAVRYIRSRCTQSSPTDATAQEFSSVLEQRSKIHSAGIILKLAYDLFAGRAITAPDSISPVLRDAAAGLQLRHAHLLYRSSQYVVSSQVLERLMELLNGRAPFDVGLALQTAVSIQLAKKAKIAASLEKLQRVNNRLCEVLFK